MGLWRTDVAFIYRSIVAVAGYGALLGISGGYRLFRGREGLGLGDVKLLGALGAWFGWQALPFILLFAASLGLLLVFVSMAAGRVVEAATRVPLRSEEHTSELQSLMRISYAVFCLKKKIKIH